MKNKKTLTIQQREKALIELIKDSENLGFNGDLIKEYKIQLKEIQEDIKREKERLLKFNIIERGFKTEC